MGTERVPWSTEVIRVRFRGGPDGSPGYLHEVITIRDGVQVTCLPSSGLAS